MDVEAWIISQLEPIAPDAPGEITLDGPAGLVVRAEVDWFEGDTPEAECRGVNVEVEIHGEPVGSFAYIVPPAVARR